MGGDRPIGLVVAGIVLGVFALLPALIVPAFYLFANVTAVVTGTDLSSDTLNVAVLLTGLVVIVALLVAGMAVAVNLIGRSLSPKRRDEHA